MKKILFLIIPVALILLMVYAPGCKKSETTPSISDLDLEINNFIWQNMSVYYLWTANVPNLDPGKYKTQKDLDAFLNKYTDHYVLFGDLLYNYGTVDKWSWIVEDYVALENEFQGITKSMGFEYGLAKSSSSNNVYGFVFYVVKNSPADLAGIKRGDIFNKVDDQQLTTSNYQTLLYGKDAFSLSFADIINSVITSNSRKVSLTAAEVHENPIFLDTIYTVNSTKIGYLVYNGFMSNYDNQLNKVFKYFKDNGIQKLILDLRYNPGGAGQSATYLASMIYGTDTTKVFYKNQYNGYIQAELLKDPTKDYINVKFAKNIVTSPESTREPINTLNLNRLYVITTSHSASASELLINGLIPYMTVTQFGDNTYGKYVGSVTLKDEDINGNVNPDHKWALQPIILKYANAQGTTDFVDGLIPTFRVDEDLTNMSTLGNVNEKLLKATLDYITGSVKKGSVITSPFVKLADSKDLIPHGKELHFNIRALGLKSIPMK